MSQSNSQYLAPSELILNQDGSVYHLGLVPDQLSDRIITVGDPDRVDSVLKYASSVEFKQQRREFVAATANFDSKRITVLSTGMGTDNIEILLNELDALSNIDLEARQVKSVHKSLKIVRVGTSGALQPEVDLGAILCTRIGIGIDALMAFYKSKNSVVEQAITTGLQSYLDLSLRPYCTVNQDRLLDKFMASGYYGEGVTLTCPGFYAPQGRVLRLEPAISSAIDQYRSFRFESYNSLDRITNFEMETAGYYALCRLLGHQTVSVNAIVAHRYFNKFADNAPEVIDQAIQSAIELI